MGFGIVVAAQGVAEVMAELGLRRLRRPPIGTGGGLYVFEMTQNSGTMAFSNCSGEQGMETPLERVRPGSEVPKRQGKLGDKGVRKGGIQQGRD